MKITQICRIKFSINDNYVDEVECEVFPSNAYEVMFSRQYTWKRDANFYRGENKYFLIKGGESYNMKAQIGRGKTSPVIGEHG